MKGLRLFTLCAVVFAVTSCQKKPEACFTPDETEVYEGETIVFTNCSQDAVSQLWTVSDGQEFETEDIELIFTTAGSYDVTLVSYSKKERKKDSETITITVLEQTNPTAVKITSIDVTNWPETTDPVILGFGTLWDIIDDADLKISIEQGITEVVVGATIHENAVWGTTYSFTDEFPLTANLTSTYSIYLLDNDPSPDTDDAIGDLSFMGNDYVFSTPTSISLANDDIALTLHLEWIY
jgi:PKD repeat protein